MQFKLSVCIDYLLASKSENKSLPLSLLWEAVIHGLAKVWPSDSSRTTLQGKSLGDAWPCSALAGSVDISSMNDEEKEKIIVPFHKLSQWVILSSLAANVLG